MDIISAAGINQSDDITEAVELYTEMIKTMKRVKELRDKGIDAGHEHVRFCKLEVKTNAAFRKLDNRKQRLAAEILVGKGLMSQKLLDVLMIFGGRISKV
ncbi:MAG: hypothetical protein H6753_00975 [Candidatus Omnitrophica bacterium]|nr:hypothetical protein [Candidatus Omnitrophota bacterium]